MNKEPSPGIYFDRINYIFLILGIVLIAAGYILMIGGGSSNPEVFNPAIFDTQRITVAPVTCLLGFAVIIFAIMRRPRAQKSE